MDALLWQAMCGHNSNGSVGLHKHTHKLKQQFSLAYQRLVKALLRFTFATLPCYSCINIRCSRYCLKYMKKCTNITVGVLSLKLFRGPNYFIKEAYLLNIWHFSERCVWYENSPISQACMSEGFYTDLVAFPYHV